MHTESKANMQHMQCGKQGLVFIIIMHLKTSHNRYIQGSKIALFRSYLRVPQAAGQVKILIFLVKITFFPLYANKFCDAGQVPILRYFEA